MIFEDFGAILVLSMPEPKLPVVSVREGGGAICGAGQGAVQTPEPPSLVAKGACAALPAGSVSVSPKMMGSWNGLDWKRP